MGVYIKGMEMPTKGYRLILVHADGTVQTTDGETAAISVPPHGRVIDVDKVLDELAHNLGIRSLDYLTPSERAIVSWFRDAPTIIPAEPPKEEQFGKTEQLKQEYYHAFCSRCGRPVIAKKEEAFWWPGGTTDDHLCISCDICGGLAEV